MQKYIIALTYLVIGIFLSGDPVSAEVLPLTFGAVVSLPHAVEMVSGSIHQRRFIGEYSCLEIAVAFSLHADTGTREVGGADIGHRAVEYHYFEMYTRTELTLQFRP